jgi:Kef-type K+ transport system membrane component KefB
MPAVVLEIVLGIVVGPSGLGWVRVDVPVSVLAIIGLSFLLFLAGLELNFGALRGRVARSSAAYAVSAVLALGGGAVVALLNRENKPLFIAIVLASTSLGLVVPVLRDAGQTFSSYGQLVLAASSIGEFGAIVALAVFYSQNGAGFGSQLFLLIGFAILVAAVAAGLVRIERSPASRTHSPSKAKRRLSSAYALRFLSSPSSWRCRANSASKRCSARSWLARSCE